MCNLYNMVTNAQAMIELGFRWEKANTNLPPLCGIYPDYLSELKATCEVLGLRYKDLENLAYVRHWYRPRRPYVRTGIGPLDNLRRRCFSACITMAEIDDRSNAKGYFARRGWVRRGLDQRLIDRIHDILDDAERRD